MAAPAQIPIAAPAQIPMAALAQIPMAAPAQIPMAAPAQIPMAAPAQIPMAAILIRANNARQSAHGNKPYYVGKPYLPAPGRRLEGSAAAAAGAPAAGVEAGRGGSPAEAGRQQRRVGRGGSAAGVDGPASRGSKAQQQHSRKDTRNRCAIGPASRGSISENLLGKSVIQSGDRVALQIGGTQYV